MTARGLLSVGLKLVGVLYVAYAVSYIPSLIGFFSREPEGNLVKSVPLAVSANLSGVILFGLIAWVLIAKGEMLAERLMTNDLDISGLNLSPEVFWQLRSPSWASIS